ncbi:MAG: FHA domain-containing protein [Micromonosporaceae bacterium]
MADRGEMGDRPLRAPVPSRNRKRWAIAGGIAGLWMLLLAGTHSIVGGTAVLLLIAALAVGVFVGLRSLGFDRYHPWVQRAATRPWRDGRDVLQLALRHLSEAFVVTPSGSLLAPNLVELRMNPSDVASLTEVMELEVINSSATELYQSKVAAHGARLAGPGPVEVGVVADPEIPVGRYRLKQGRRAKVACAAGQAMASQAVPSKAERPQPVFTPAMAPEAVPAPAMVPEAMAPQDLALQDLAPQDLAPPDVAPRLDWRAYAAYADRSAPPTLVRDVLTVAAPSPPPTLSPPLRLLTNGSVTQTHVSGARAGRGGDVELPLPDEPTVSRVHAEFTFAEGQWRITSLGRNGLLVNDVPVAGEHPVRDGDLIKWGPHPGALVSRVQVG